MAQHDYTIANQGFPAFRSDLNDALAAIVSNNSGATEPTTMFAHQMWVDTAADPSVLKIRNADNDAWITIGTIDQTGDTFTLTSAVSATTLNTSGAVVFNDAGADVDFRVEGDTDANLLFVDASTDRIGVGTNTPANKLDVNGQITASSGFNSGDALLGNGALISGGATSDCGIRGGGNILFAPSSTAERGRFTSGGFFKASNTGSYRDANANNHELVNSIADIASFFLGNSSASPYGQQILFSGASPNNTTNYFLAGDDSTTRRVVIYSNGNIVNVNNSYGAISDVKLKQDIVDAGSQWDDIKGLRIRKFHWKSDPNGFMHIGLVAQEAEEVSPGLIDESPDFEEVEVPVLDDEGNAVLNEDGTPQVTKERNALGTTTKAVKYSILYMKAVKALQEAMERIETLEAKVAALENA